MGSTSVSSPQAPVAPTAEETTREAIQGQVESLPDILAAQQEFGPQFADQAFQQQMRDITEFGPQAAEASLALQEQFGPRFAEALRAEQEAASPELGASRRVLTDYLNQEELLTPEEERKMQQDTRAAQNVRGFALESGVGAQDELKNMTALRQQLKERRLNIALSTSGRAPVTGQTQFQGGGQFGPGQLVQNVNPGQIFGLASSNFGTQANIFGTQSANAQANAGGGLGAQLGAGALGAFGGAFGMGSGLGAASMMPGGKSLFGG